LSRPVSAVDPVVGSVTVLGQTVLVTPATVFDPSLAGGFELADRITVEVYGRYDAAKGRYTATRIEARPIRRPTSCAPMPAIDRQPLR